MVEEAELAQSVERTTLNRVVGGSIPPFGVILDDEASPVFLIFVAQNLPI